MARHTSSPDERSSHTTLPSRPALKSASLSSETIAALRSSRVTPGTGPADPQQRLNFLPLPQGQGSLRPGEGIECVESYRGALDDGRLCG